MVGPRSRTPIVKSDEDPLLRTQSTTPPWTAKTTSSKSDKRTKCHERARSKVYYKRKGG